MSDRLVHAECAGFQVVRYNRAGKWYVETRGDGPRERVDITEAAHRALAAKAMGGTVYMGAPGGTVFDSRFRKLDV